MAGFASEADVQMLSQGCYLKYYPEALPDRKGRTLISTLVKLRYPGQGCAIGILQYCWREAVYSVHCVPHTSSARRFGKALITDTSTDDRYGMD